MVGHISKKRTSNNDGDKSDSKRNNAFSELRHAHFAVTVDTNESKRTTIMGEQTAEGKGEKGKQKNTGGENSDTKRTASRHCCRHTNLVVLIQTSKSEDTTITATTNTTKRRTRAVRDNTVGFCSRFQRQVHKCSQLQHQEWNTTNKEFAESVSDTSTALCPFRQRTTNNNTGQNTAARTKHNKKQQLPGVHSRQQEPTKNNYGQTSATSSHMQQVTGSRIQHKDTHAWL